MPLDTAGHFFYGPDARTIWKTTRNTFMDTLRAALNDVEGDYQGSIGKPVTVTPSEKLAGLLYDDDSDEALIYVVRAALSDSTWGKTIGPTFYEGKRYEISLTLDFSMGAPLDPDSPVDETEADQDLADALSYFIKASVSQFNALGLHNIAIVPDAEKQSAGIGRNPHRVSFLAFALNDYSPSP